MKIAYCIYQIGAGGGVERVLTSKVNWLVAHGHEVVILACLYDGRLSSYGIDPKVRVLSAGIPYAEDFAKPLHKRMLCTLARMRQHKRWMREVLMRERFDIVVTTHVVETSFLPSIADGSRKVLELHTSAEAYQRERQPKKWSLRQLLVKCYEWRDRYNLSRFDAVGCLTSEDYALRGKPKNMVVIPNPLPFVSAEPSRLEHKVVLAVGRLSKEKNLLALVDIWQEVATHCPDWKLRLVGNGNERAKIIGETERRGLDQQIEVLPFAREILPYYLEASIYAMTSLYEGMPMALLEAQACGLPIVSYACPCGPSDIIADGEDGFLVSPGDKKLFAERLVQLMSDEDLRRRMGAEAYKSSERFTEESVMRQWLELFVKLVYARNN